MTIVFYISVVVALGAALLAVTRQNVVHALLYLVTSLLALALAIFALGAPFAAALEVIVYAGAIVVLFVFVVMTLNLRPPAVPPENQWLAPQAWAGPALLVLVLLAELVYVLVTQPSGAQAGAASLDPKQVGIALLGPYVLATELASMLLLAGLVGAYHLGRREEPGALETPPAGQPRGPAVEEVSSSVTAGGKP